MIARNADSQPQHAQSMRPLPQPASSPSSSDHRASSPDHDGRDDIDAASSQNIDDTDSVVGTVPTLEQHRPDPAARDTTEANGSTELADVPHRASTQAGVPDMVLDDADLDLMGSLGISGTHPSTLHPPAAGYDSKLQCCTATFQRECFSELVRF